MSSTISRRKLLRTGGQAFITGGVAVCGGPALKAKSSSKASAKGVDYDQQLGVNPFINAAGTYPVLSASTMPEEVQAAIALAAKQPVNLNELLDASGEYLAKRLRCEAALVTTGAAAALVVGTAACVTRSEEHTSELQSQSNLVCRLLLEKKKKPNYRSLRAIDAPRGCTGARRRRPHYCQARADAEHDYRPDVAGQARAHVQRAVRCD